MREIQEIVIGDYTYTVAQLPTTRALKLFHRLAAAASPAIGKLAAAVSGSSAGLASLDVAVIGPALEAVFEKMSAEQFVEVTKELMQGCAVTGEGVENPDLSKQPVFDRHFTGRLLEVFKLLRFALQVNYGDFLGELLAFAKTAQAGKTTVSPSLPS